LSAINYNDKPGQMNAAIVAKEQVAGHAQAGSGAQAISRPPARLALPAWLGNLLLKSNALVVFLVLYLPVVILIVFSFNAARSGVNWTGFSLDWYNKLLHDGNIGSAAIKTLIVAGFATAISTIIGTMTALALERHKFVGKVVFEGVMYLPIIIPEIVMGLSLLLFFRAVGVDLSLVTVIIAHVVFCIPFVAVIVRARLADFDRRLEEAAMDLGADELATFRKVTLPLLMPAIIGGAVMAFTLSIDDVIVTQFTAGVGSTTLPLYIYSQVRVGITPVINALSTIMLVASIGLVLTSLFLQRDPAGKKVK